MYTKLFPMISSIYESPNRMKCYFDSVHFLVKHRKKKLHEKKACLFFQNNLIAANFRNAIWFLLLMYIEFQTEEKNRK